MLGIPDVGKASFPKQVHSGTEADSESVLDRHHHGHESIIFREAFPGDRSRQGQWKASLAMAAALAAPGRADGGPHAGSGRCAVAGPGQSQVTAVRTRSIRANRSIRASRDLTCDSGCKYHDPRTQGGPARPRLIDCYPGTQGAFKFTACGGDSGKLAHWCSCYQADHDNRLKVLHWKG